jgi:hypothetical protein
MNNEECFNSLPEQYWKQYFKLHISTKCLRTIMDLISFKVTLIKPKQRLIELATFNSFLLITRYLKGAKAPVNSITTFYYISISFSLSLPLSHSLSLASSLFLSLFLCRGRALSVQAKSAGVL